MPDKCPNCDAQWCIARNRCSRRCSRVVDVREVGRAETVGGRTDVWTGRLWQEDVEDVRELPYPVHNIVDENVRRGYHAHINQWLEGNR